MSKTIQAVFIDRDGTIGGADKVVYPEDFQLYPYALTSIKQLKKAGKLIFSFTNQPGISKGEDKMEDFEKELISFGFDKVYICPHQHNEECGCRKPAIGMLIQAAKENNLDLKQCVVIGDRWTDMVAADEAGCIKILVKTGAGTEAFKKYKNNEYFGRWGEVTPDFIADNL
jgi:histidinol-phosphate phosphatase family protein